jgi:NifU-like protein involved in Fe-S cluster formation
MDDLYSQRLLEAAASLPQAGRLDAPTGTGRRSSKVCGSEVEVDLLVDGGIVTDHALRVKACALGQASTALLSEALNDASAEELRALAPVMEAMLKADGPPPEGRFAHLQALQPIRAYPARHASTLLIFGAVVDALDEAEAKNAA